MPLFSIVIPVRDRANMLRYALRSVLNQTFNDYEVVVSDNSSSDNTPDVVKEFSDSRIRYFRTDRLLPMHENYEFVFSKAEGEWVICLTSRFVMWRNALQEIANAINKYSPAVINWPYGLYYTDTWFEPQKHNKMVLYYPYSTKITEQSADTVLQNMFNLTYHDFNVPQPGYSAYHRNVLGKVKERFGRIFFPPAPDRTSCVALLSCIDKFYTINAPLMLSGICAESNGGSFSFQQDKEYVKFLDEYKGYRLLEYVPLKVHLSIAHSAESFLKIKMLAPERFSHLQLDLSRFFTLCYEEIMSRQRKGIDVISLKNEFFRELHEQSFSVRKQVSRRIPLVNLFVFLRAFVPLIDNRKITSYLAQLITKRQVICGNEAEFNNILEAEGYLNHLLEKLV